jgi:nucleoside phosphorylase
VIVATGVAAPDGHHATCLPTARLLAARLSGHPKRVIMADVAGVDRAVVSPLEKQALRDATGALAVDMESHVAAAFASRHRLPFAAVGGGCGPPPPAGAPQIAPARRPEGRVSVWGGV